MISLVITTDGRASCLEQCIASVRENINGVATKTIIDDSADAGYALWLDQTFPDFRIVHHETRRGLGGAVRSAWTEALSSRPNYVFHCEDDFTFVEPVDLEWMTDLLVAHPHLAQISLKRQPVDGVEINAGDFMKVDPLLWTNCFNYVEHETLFTFNPCVIPAMVAQIVLNDGTCDTLERGVSDVLLRNGYKFGVFGNTWESPRVTHIGNVRSSGWRV